MGVISDHLQDEIANSSELPGPEEMMRRSNVAVTEIVRLSGVFEDARRRLADATVALNRAEAQQWQALAERAASPNPDPLLPKTADAKKAWIYMQTLAEQGEAEMAEAEVKIAKQAIDAVGAIVSVAQSGMRLMTMK